MFTGIVEETGKIVKVTINGLEIKAHKVLEGTKTGDSIAVNGVCLTVTRLEADSFTVDVMPETMRCTTLSQLKTGDTVNLERALTLSSRLGGHIVSGHIDGTGKITALNDEGNAVLMEIMASAELLRYIVSKGSVALDGISLTVADVKDDRFIVSLIPHTREVTALKSKRIGDVINIETDIIGRYVEKMMNEQNGQEEKSGLTRDFLAEYGF